MSDYRRFFVAGGSFFFTVVAHGRVPLFSDPEAAEILGEKIRTCQQEWPFEINAIVLLPEHLHSIWTLPPGDTDYPKRWGWIKKEFTKTWIESGGKEQQVSESRRKRGDRGVWQPRYWEHTLRDENDFERHFDYIHYNPVKHGHVLRPCDWPASSFHRWVKSGIYDWNWGRTTLNFDDLNQTAMEMGVA